MLQYCRKPPLNIERTDCDSDAGECFVESYWVVVGIFYNLLIRVYEKNLFRKRPRQVRQKEIYKIFSFT